MFSGMLSSDSGVNMGIKNAISESLVMMDNVNSVIDNLEKGDYLEVERIIEQELVTKLESFKDRGIIHASTADNMINKLEKAKREVTSSSGVDPKSALGPVEQVRRMIWQEMADDVALYVRSPKFIGAKRRVSE